MATDPKHLDSRRSFLRKGAMIAGTALAGPGIARSAPGAPLEVPPTAKEMGRPIPPTAYGVPSRFEGHVARRRTDVFVNRQNWSDWSMTPLQHQHGIVTPTGLIFERHHAGVPDIDPSTHKLAIHGMVKQPLRFTMNAALPRGLEVPLPRVLRQHAGRLDEGGLDDGPADARPALRRPVDRGPGRVAAR